MTRIDDASLGGRLDTVLAERVNDEPAILRGCSSSELVMVLIVSICFWMPLALVIGILTDRLAMALGLAGAMVMVSVWLGAVAFQHIKRGRPPGYYQQAIPVWLHKRGLRRSKFALPQGQLSLGRNCYDHGRKRPT